MRPNQQFIDSLTILNKNIFYIDSITGGTTTSVGADTLVTFTQSGSFRVVGSGTVSILLVGGGGGGNTSAITTNLSGGGGGGGGGIAYYTSTNLQQLSGDPIAGQYSAIVGTGGGGGVFVSSGNADNYMGKPGGNTYIQKNGAGISYGAFGGGYKFGNLIRYTYDVGRNSGAAIDSGLGPPYTSVYYSPASVAPYGSGGANILGPGLTTGAGATNIYTNNITGTGTIYGAAGGGGARGGANRAGASGGAGGGGTGGGISSTGVIIPPTNGQDYVGAGGGGGSINPGTGLYSFGATGGSGIIIIRYRAK